ncbi:MAG: hypothetical protein FJ090_21830 [Deltaproteobacteria bacterium]|nr:hypothetical protein [Deltaproteobacteria bacterium]
MLSHRPKASGSASASSGRRNEGIVYPRHHKRFFGAFTLEELKEARRFLCANSGTVCERGQARPAQSES